MDDNNRESFVLASVTFEKTNVVLGSFNKKINEIVKMYRTSINAARDQGLFMCTVPAPDPQFQSTIHKMLIDTEHTVVPDIMFPGGQKWCICWNIQK